MNCFAIHGILFRQTIKKSVPGVRRTVCYKFCPIPEKLYFLIKRNLCGCFQVYCSCGTKKKKTKKNFTVPHFRTNIRTLFFMKYCCAWRVIHYIREEAHLMKISIFFIRISLHDMQNIALSMDGR